ncbi:MAG: glycerophosphodiester phosphodiesterase family protein, partial [Pseudomonadota bacterium]
PNLPPVIGHRGAALYAPENTIAGLHEASRRGVKMVEVDVRLTADGQPVIFHDDTLDRTTNGVGPLDHALFDEVRRVDAGVRFGEDWQGERIPTLEEVIATTGTLGLGLNLEIKSLAHRAEETARVALEQTRDLWPSDRPAPLISSFQYQALVTAKDIAPDWPRGLLLGGQMADWRARAEAIDAATINTYHAVQTRDSIATFRAFGKPVLCYTVNDPGRAADLFDWGVSAVFSDAPDIVKPPG